MGISVMNQRTERTRKYHSCASQAGEYNACSAISAQTYRSDFAVSGCRMARALHAKPVERGRLNRVPGISACRMASPLHSEQQRRKMSIRKHLLKAVTAVVLLFLLGAVLSGFSRMQLSRAPVYKYYTAVTVQRDDTLWDIARQNITEEYRTLDSYIREIKEVNDMKSDHLYYGQKLILPYYSSLRK